MRAMNDKLMVCGVAALSFVLGVLVGSSAYPWTTFGICMVVGAATGGIIALVRRTRP